MSFTYTSDMKKQKIPDFLRDFGKKTYEKSYKRKESVCNLTYRLGLGERIRTSGLLNPIQKIKRYFLNNQTISKPRIFKGFESIRSKSSK